MALVFFGNQESEERAKVTNIHYKPELLNSIQRDKGIEIDNIPQPEKQEGKSAVLYVNPKTSDLWYEYVDKKVKKVNPKKPDKK